MILWLVLTLVVALSLFCIGNRLARRLEPGLLSFLLVGTGVAAAVPGVVFASYYLKVLGEPIWLYEFRSLPFTELTAGGSGFFAGLLHGRYSDKPRFRRVAGRWFFPGVLLIGLLVPYVKPILRPARWDLFQDRWSDGVCLQTSESSCGPACAATLLKMLGMSATEKDLAREAFTSRSGTENWYLARAIRRRKMGVRFLLQTGTSQTWPFPSIAGVRLSSLGNSGHFITILGREGDKYIIGDPLEGRLTLSTSALESRYSFTGFFMLLAANARTGSEL
jgi:hypothetical protein